jgi:aspartate-semialdehyde dehydrogenase
MESGLLKIGIVGASSLLGKELAEELSGSAFAAADVVLLDEEEVTGQITAVGDEASFIRRIEGGSFTELDVVFFAGKKAQTLRHWAAVKKSGASVVDMTAALAGEAGVMVRSPWVADKAKAARLDLGTVGVVPAHPAAVMIGLIAARCAKAGVTRVAATVLEPASERGQAGMDEMHQQTVSLLSFQAIPRQVFDAQVAFNLISELGEAAEVKLEDTAARVVRDYRMSGALPELTVQMLHAPVFHGYGISLLLEGTGEMDAETLERAIYGEHVDVVGAESDAPSNLSAAGQGEVLVRVGRGSGSRMWVWMVADNLKLAALHGIACAMELEGLRPQGTVQ